MTINLGLGLERIFWEKKTITIEVTAAGDVYIRPNLWNLLVSLSLCVCVSLSLFLTHGRAHTHTNVHARNAGWLDGDAALISIHLPLGTAAHYPQLYLILT